MVFTDKEMVHTGTHKIIHICIASVDMAGYLEHGLHLHTSSQAVAQAEKHAWWKCICLNLYC